MKKIYNKILQISGNVIVLSATGIRYGELALIKSKSRDSLAEVIRIDDDLVYLQVFSGSSGISTGDEIRFLGKQMEVSFSDNLLGRVFDGAGRPRDGGPMLTEDLIEIGGPTVNPARRTIPSNMIHTGIPMIDLFNSLVESQKISIFTTSGEPYNELLTRISLQAKVDIIVLGGMGIRYDDFLFLKNTLEKEGALNHSLLCIHTASDPVVESIMVPDISLTIAENFALHGKKVLVLLTDMKNYCDALKEIAIIMEQVPSNRGYPGDLYTQLASKYEKAVDFEGAGSVTILSVTTMPGNDVTHPVPDNTGYITEGQYYLNNGRIEPFGSLSRLKQFVNKETRDDHRPLMDAMVQLYAFYQEALEKKTMGFRMTGWDDKLLKFGALFEQKLMDLSVNISLEKALDTGWRILSECFTPEETGIRNELVMKYWRQSKPLQNS
ncbi:MAG: V-type ATP synthase subunit B [Candidatus Scalindua sp. AMX11]|nr:MAG: V-type ATP synthase subunit B [Candidatus Scalindua sp.]NOG83083.1 V-type ATP synthase subunit B [Planctomycetota bacterium]RZV63117.1 MAG: V-type ATP synthase subunit B [Candidatus Scalindua sp. SCAELEC01]TDE63353.1 MAG: V-type ATP synthase subunit B [Candidatus Scalindua sp. AMX11]GJQ57376.1 MAG: V-type ATP synthase beta chain [Candidatus Scalindua sp.]